MTTNKGRSVEVTHTESMCHFLCNYVFKKQSLSKKKVLGIMCRPTSEECLICDIESDSIDDRRKPLTTEGVCGVYTRRKGERWKPTVQHQTVL